MLRHQVRSHLYPICAVTLKCFGIIDFQLPLKLFLFSIPRLSLHVYICGKKMYRLLQDMNLQKSWLATESAYIIPTTAGLPLNLSVTASVALDIHASGKIDVFNLLQGRGGISGRLKPR